MTRIYLETKHRKTSEAVFIKTLLTHIGKSEESYEIICVDGKDNLSCVAPKLQETIIEGSKNIIIFDADTEKNKGGFIKRKAEIEAKLLELGVHALIFLFPNNSEDGDVESLLERLMQTNTHKRFFDCYHDYEACLGLEYRAPNLKGKLHTYISAQKDLTTKQIRNLGSGQWLFDDIRFWDLDNEALNPLKEFLELNIE